MTNFELNKAIAEALGLCIEKKSVIDVGRVDVWVDDDCIRRIPDYCCNWNDLMPLVIKYKISLMAVFDEWWTRVGDFTTSNMRHRCKQDPKNPQRVLAECLLKVLQGEQNEDKKNKNPES